MLITCYQAPRPLRLNDIVSKSSRLRESKYAKKERKEREKADKAAGRSNYAPIDLTDEHAFIPGHMVSSPEPIRGRDRPNNNYNYEAGRRVHTNRSEGMSSFAGQKRKHNNSQGSLQDSTLIYDPNRPEELQLGPVENKPKLESYEIEDEDIYNDSDSRRHRKKSRRKNYSHRAKVLVPGADFLFASPGRTLRDKEELSIRLGSASSSQQETPQSLRSRSSTSQAYQKNLSAILGCDSDHEAHEAKTETNKSGTSRQGFHFEDKGSNIVEQ